MAKPFFITTTARPAETVVPVGEDTLAVKKVKEVPPADVELIERSSGVSIKTDSDLTKAKEKILQNSTSRDITIKGITTESNSSALTVSDLSKLGSGGSVDTSTLSKLQDKLKLGLDAKDACPEIGFSCGWFDLSKLKLDISLSKYADSAKSLLKRTFTIGDAGIFGNIIRCGSFLAASGVKKFNEVAKLASGMKNTDFLKHVGESAITVDGAGGSSAKGKVPSMGSLLSNSLGSAEKGSLSVGGVQGLLNSTGIGATEILGGNTAKVELAPGDTTTQVSTNSISKLMDAKDTQASSKTLIAGKKSKKPDRQKIVTLSTALQMDGDYTTDPAHPQLDADIQQGGGSLAMANGVVMDINDGKNPEGSLSSRDVRVSKITNEPPEISVRNTAVNNNDDIIESMMAEKVALDNINKGGESANANKVNINDIKIKTTKSTSTSSTAPTTKEERSNILSDTFLSEYIQLEASVT